MPSDSNNGAIALIQRQDVVFFASLLRGLEGSIYPILQQAKVPIDLYSSESNYDYLPENTVKNLIQALGERLEHQEFIQLISSACKNIYIPEFIRRLTQSGSLREALDEFAKQLKSNITHTNVYTQFSGGSWWLVREKEGVDEAWFTHAELFSVIFTCELLSALTSNKWRPKQVGIQSADEAVFSTLPQLTRSQFFTNRPVTAFSIEESLMTAPVSHPYISTKDPIAAIPSRDCFLGTFKLAIQPYLSMGKLPIKMAAQILQLNVRTLQRRLAKESVQYGAIIEEMVLEQTLDLLKCPSLKITSIAIRMGYSDAAHFTRAFKRQMQMTPTAYRRQFD
ncbi:helix-turn-helix domain-containing protein [Shewanella pealeana]|uniref:Transcriptional regulator, AraC family n=1 Tax=Shewanella pealeana (strain ATCC 700345 / ANG-SQ1) TaxID=398579 RepID=A8H6Z5_SHEPA|nr:helix-turn-helix domain-containing protein [Shewanella pealeana]ABV88332.1 transcriptional regulator, AraC family [Shewanella pealeana ATCC 700345]